MIHLDNLQSMELLSDAHESDYGLFDEQKEAFVDVIAYIIDGTHTKHLLFNASAGTGKTFTVRAVVDFLYNKGIIGSVIAFTGRACSQLKKGIEFSKPQTIHSLFYKPKFDKDGNLIGFDEKSRKEVLDDAGSYIMVDEASMVPLKIFKQILSIGLPVVLVGDLSQLEAVDPAEKSQFNAMDTRAYAAGFVSLEVNRRTDPESEGIVKLYELLKKENSMPRSKGNGLKMIPRTLAGSMAFLRDNQFDVILCGMNKTRKKLNDTIRNIKFGGRPPECPEVGEIVICLRNDYVGTVQINNGERFEVTGVVHAEPISTYMMKSLDADMVYISVEVHNSTWATEDIPQIQNLDQKKKLKKFGFGYAISVHKAQGSTFDNVLFFDEDVGFFLDRRKFRYTAVTRAAKTLTIAL